MREKIKLAIIKLQQSTKPNAAVKFTHNAKDKSKSFIANVHYDDVGLPAISLLNNSGYNERYIKAKLNSDFKDIILETLPYAGPGDTIRIRPLSNLPAPGTQINLNASTEYFSVNGGIISCNGRQLGRNFQGHFTGKDESVCATGGAIMSYYIINLS